VLDGPAKVLWRGDSSALPGLQNDGLPVERRAVEIVEHDYCYILTVTREDLKQQLIDEAEKASAER
jgi:DNA topoisomerase VI subunit A